MRLVFFGTGSFAVPALRALQEHIVLVVSQPDRPSGRGMRFQASDVKRTAEDLGISVSTPERSRSPEFVEHLRAMEADALVVASYGQILSQDVLDAAAIGGINLHGSILPMYRGAAPIQRAILDRQAETGVTLMQMAKGMDTGDIIAVQKTSIAQDETYGQLQERLAAIGADLAAEWMPRIVKGGYPRLPQDESKASYAPKVEKHEGQLNFFRPALEEYARFRAFTPSPGATILTDFGLIRISCAALGGEGTFGSPGTVLSTSPNLSLSFGKGSIELIDVQPEGKKRMSGRDLANGLRLKPGNKIYQGPTPHV
jgi:methionyl-tRNA formyltransferase